MHHIHHTEAFVLKTFPSGEDSKTLVLYTRELGLVRAHAQALRKLASKLRFILQDHSHVQLDLVRGKEIWRVTTAIPVAHAFSPRTHEREDALFGRIAALLMRLVAGEERNDEVFSALVRLESLLVAPVRDAADYRMIELLTVARILVALGYLSRDTLGGAADESAAPQEIFADISVQHRLIRDINMALAASQL